MGGGGDSTISYDQFSSAVLLTVSTMLLGFPS